MRAVVFRAIPEDVERVAGDPLAASRIDGDGVARAAIVRALLDHGHFDNYYVLTDSKWFKPQVEQALERTPSGRRATAVTPRELSALKHERRIALFEPGLDFYHLAAIRNVYGNPCWPTTGLTHTLSYYAMWSRVLMPLLGRRTRHDGFICTTPSARDVLERMIEDQSRKLSDRFSSRIRLACRLDVIPLCVDATVYRPATRDEKDEAKAALGLGGRQIILCLGRLTAAMKMDLGPLVVAFSRFVSPAVPSAHLVLAGDDSRKEAATLRHLCRELGCEPRVTTLTNLSREQKLQLYAAADLFVAPSDNVQETFGQAVVEAMAAGLPVIASDWNGFRETVDHGTTGLRVPTQWVAATDEVCRTAPLRVEPRTHAFLAQTVVLDIEALASAMRTLLTNDTLRQRMGEAARARVLERYDCPRVVARYEELWEEMWSDPQPVPRGAVTQEFGVLDRFQLFEGYPTSRIGPDAQVTLTAIGHDYVGALPALRNAWARVPLFDEALCTTIVAICNCHPKPVREVIQLCQKATNEDPEEIFRHVAHLAKQGVVRLDAPADAHVDPERPHPP